MQSGNILATGQEPAASPQVHASTTDADNVVRGGSVLEPDGDPEIAGSVRRFNAELASRPELESTVLLHYKGKLDGLSVSRRR